jgi:hypothetical protein
MGIITGATRVHYDYGKEAHDEQKKWGKEKREADISREVESERYTWWGIGTTLGCLALGGGPICPAVGAVVANVAKGVGTYKREAIESYDLSEDVGKFEKGQIEDIRNYNRSLDAADKAEFWQGIKDIGTSLLFSWTYGTSGKEGISIGEKIGSWSPTKWGGKEGTTYGGKEVWERFFTRPDSATPDIIDVSTTYAGRHGPDYSRYYHDMPPADTHKISYPTDIPQTPTTPQLKSAGELLWDIMYGKK